MSADGDITINMITFEGGYGAPGYAQMPMPMPVPTPPVHPGGHASLPHGAPYPPGMAAPYPTQHGMSYPVAPGYPGAMPGAPNPYAHLSPKSAVSICFNHYFRYSVCFLCKLHVSSQDLATAPILRFVSKSRTFICASNAFVVRL